MDDDAEVADLAAEVGRCLQARKDEVTDGMSALLAADVDGLDDDPDLVKMLYASVEGNVTTIFHILTNDIPLAHLQPTTAAVEYAIRLAQRGIPGNSLRRAYHVGQDYLLEGCYDEIRKLGCLPELEVRVLHRILRLVNGYIDWITQFVLQAYDDERQRRIAASGNMVSSLVNRVLAQQPVNASAFATDTGYSLDQIHIGAVLWVPEDESGAESVMGLERLAQDIAARDRSLHAPIFTAVQHNLAWAWFGRGNNREPIDMRAVCDLADDCQGRITVGTPQQGVAGFRRTHQQAVSARNLALQSSWMSGNAVSYGDQGVAVVSMLARDLDTTRFWVIEQLGGLARDTAPAQRLRETLHTFLSTGGSYTESAALLNLHRNSVRYRVDKAIEERGRPLADDRLDLELALQVCQFLGTAVLADDDQPSK